MAERFALLNPHAHSGLSPREFLLPPGRVVRVGCDPTADWCVADPSLAPRHCELSFEDGVLSVRDLDSPGGVSIDGTRVFHAPIPAGGMLQVGDLRFQHVPASVTTRPPPAAAAASDAARVPAAPNAPPGFARPADAPSRFAQPTPGDGEATVLGPALDSRPTAGFDQPTPIPSDSDDGGVTIAPGRFTAAESRDGLSTVRQFGDYELLNEVARGGMGVVYRARQVSLDRIVALKMILQGEFAGEEDVIRFKREAEAAAQLAHPGIVPIYQVGQCDGQHFFTMGFIEGQSLKERMQRGPLVPREAAELLRKLAEAIAYAHRRGVVHRDLKPANVLLDAQGEPRVTDFGLARKLEQTGELTRSNAVMGTPSYMPPEQASGKSAGVGPEADIYSLGAVLYCLLTGRPPFQAANPLDTLLQVIEGGPVSPRLLNPAIDEDLNAICLKCLEKNPADRYPSAEALQADLAHFLDHEPVSIRTRTSLERLRRTLVHSRDDQELATWGDLLLGFAPLVLVPELVFQLMVGAYEAGKLEHIHRWALLMRGLQVGAMVACGWWLRDRILTSRRTTTQDMWSHWAAFLVACHLVLGVQVISGWAHPEANLSLWTCYPNFALLSGVLWFTLGSNFWGGCYAFGALHFLSALVMAWFPEIGPTLFGVLWFFSLAITGWRLKRMHRTRVEQETLSLRQ
ncbi:MAG: protein kinase domain-containing protein [Planctomycetaceae bacterium]